MRDDALGTSRIQPTSRSLAQVREGSLVSARTSRGTKRTVSLLDRTVHQRIRVYWLIEMLR